MTKKEKKDTTQKTNGCPTFPGNGWVLLDINQCKTYSPYYASCLGVLNNDGSYNANCGVKNCQ